LGALPGCGSDSHYGLFDKIVCICGWGSFQRGTHALIQFASLILLKWYLPDWGVFPSFDRWGANLREYSYQWFRIRGYRT